MRLEIGSGERPHPDYDLHVDVLPLPGVAVRCGIEALPFASGSIDALRANHVLEHQSYELIAVTLREWTRVLRPGAPVDIGVPDAKFVAEQWVRGHTMFDAGSLRAAVEEFLVVDELFTYDIRNLRVYAHKA